MVIYGFLKKRIIKHNTSVSDVSQVKEQNNIELTSTTSPDNGVDVNHGEEDTNITFSQKITMSRLDKLEGSVGRLVEKIDEISQKLQYRD